MADLLPSVQAGPSVTDAPRSSVGAADYYYLGKAWEGAFDGLKDLTEKLAAPSEGEAKAEAYQSVQRDENGNIIVKPLSRTMVGGRYAEAATRSALAVRDARIGMFLDSEAQRLAIETGKPAEQGGGGGDPSWFRKQFSQIVLGMAEGGRDGEQFTIRNAGDQIGEKYFRNLQDTRDARDGANTKATLLMRAENLTNDAMRLARASYNGPEFKASLGEIGAVFDQLASDPRTGVTPEIAKMKMERITSALAAEGTMGAVERAYDPANGGSAKQALDLAESFLTDPQFGAMSPEDRRQYRNMGVAYVREQEGAKRAVVAALQPKVDEFIKLARDGAEVNQDDLDDLTSQLAEAGGYRQIQRLVGAVHQSNLNREMRALSPVELAQRAGQMTGGNTRLMARESGGNPAVMNSFGYAGLYQFGAPRLADLGIYTPGAGEDLRSWSRTNRSASGKWTGTFNIPGHPEVRTIEQFLASPDAQREAFAAHTARMDEDITRNGLERYIGQTVGGVQITREGIHNMMHLGGTQGAVRFLTSGGTDNPGDANGTRLSDYAAMGSRAGNGEDRATRSAVVDQGDVQPFDAAEMLAIRKAAREQIGAQIPLMMKALDAFETPNPDDFRALGSLIQLAGTPDDARKYAQIAVRTGVAQAGQELPPDQFQAYTGRLIDEIRQTNDTELKALIPGMEERAKSVATQFQTEPYTAGRRIGMDLPSTKTALPFDQPEAMPQALQARLLDAQKLAQWVGKQPSVFTPAEQQKFGDMLRTGAPAVTSQTLGAIAAMPPEAIRATLGDKTVSSAIVAMSRSPQLPQAAAAFGFMDQIERKMPLDFDDMMGRDASSDLQQWRGSVSAMDDQEYRIWYRERSKGENPEAVKQATQEANKLLAKNYADPSAIVGKLSAAPWYDVSTWSYNPWSRDLAPVSDGVQGSAAALQADFNAAFIRGYQRNPGNEAAAEEFALKRIGSKWGPSVTNKGRVMESPPEKYLPQVDGSHDWIGEQLRTDVLQHFDPSGTEVRGLPGFSAPFVTPGVQDYAIVADDQTAAAVSNGLPPRYLVVAQDMNGQWHRVEDAGHVALRFVPDLAAAQAASRARFAERRRELFQLGDVGKPVSLEERTEFKPYTLP